MLDAKTTCLIIILIIHAVNFFNVPYLTTISLDTMIDDICAFCQARQKK